MWCCAQAMEATLPRWGPALGLAVCPWLVFIAAFAEPISTGSETVTLNPALLSNGADGEVNSEVAGPFGHLFLTLRDAFQRLAFGFSEEFWSPGKGRELAEAVWYPTVAASLLYFPTVILLQQRRGKQGRGQEQQRTLRWIAFIWNLLLSVLSLWGFVAATVKQPGLLLTTSFPEKDYHPTVRMVIAIFTLTKAVEFGDTILLFLKRRPIPFIHTYHHCTVTLYCLHAQYTNVSFAHLFALMNLFVHAIMYMYYAAATAAPGAKFLRRLRPGITLLQLLQMLVGMYVSVSGLLASQQLDASFQGGHVQQLDLLSHLRGEQLNARLAVCMYTSYCFLFARLYCSSYLPSFDSDRLGLALTVHAAGAIGAYQLALLFQQAPLQCVRVVLLVSVLGVVTVCAARLALKGQQREVRGKSPEASFSSGWASVVLLTNWMAGLSLKAEQNRDATGQAVVPAATAASLPCPVNAETTSAVGGFSVASLNGGSVAALEGLDRFGSRLSESSTSAGDSSDSGTPTAFAIAEDALGKPSSSGDAGSTVSCASRKLYAAAADGGVQCRRRIDAQDRSDQERPRTSRAESQRELAGASGLCRLSLLQRFVRRDDWPILTSKEWLFCVVGVLLPGVVGRFCMQNTFVGFCTIGAFRWVVELQVAKRLVRVPQ